MNWHIAISRERVWISLLIFNWNETTVGDKTAVLVVNWDRSIGVNVIRKLSRIVQGTPMKTGILIGKTFSEHSRKFASDYEVKLLSKSKMQFEMDEL